MGYSGRQFQFAVKLKFSRLDALVVVNHPPVRAEQESVGFMGELNRR